MNPSNPHPVPAEPYTHQSYPKWRHRATVVVKGEAKEIKDESVQVGDPADEEKRTPAAAGWCDLMRDARESAEAKIAENEAVSDPAPTAPPAPSGPVAPPAPPQTSGKAGGK